MYRVFSKKEWHKSLKSVLMTLRRHCYESIIYALFIMFFSLIFFILSYEIRIFNGNENEIRIFLISGASFVGLIFTVVLAVTLMAFQTVSEKYIPSIIWRFMNFPVFLYFSFCVSLAVIGVFFSARVPIHSTTIVDVITLLLILQIMLTFPYMLFLFNMLKRTNIILLLEKNHEINSLKEIAFKAYKDLDIELEGDIMVSLARISEENSQYSEKAFKSLRDISRLGLSDTGTFNFLCLVLEIRLNNAIKYADIKVGRNMIKILGLLCCDSIEETSDLQICNHVIHCFRENGLLLLQIQPVNKELLSSICRWLCEIINTAIRNSVDFIHFSGIITLLSLCGNALDQSDIMIVSNHLIESKSEIMQISEDILLEKTPSDLDYNMVLLGFNRFKDLTLKTDVKR